MVAMTSRFLDNELASKEAIAVDAAFDLEQRPVAFKDIGRQVLATGIKKRPEYFMQAINGISKDEINRVAQGLLKSPPCLAARGEVKTVPSMAGIQNDLHDAQDRLPGSRSRLSLLRYPHG